MQIEGTSDIGVFTTFLVVAGRFRLLLMHTEMHIKRNCMASTSCKNVLRKNAFVCWIFRPSLDIATALGRWVQMRRDYVSWLQKLFNMFVTWCSKQQKCTKVTEKEKSFKSCSKKSAEKFCLCFFLHQRIMYCDCHASQQPFYFVNVCVCQIVSYFSCMFTFCYCGFLCHINTYGLHCYIAQ